MDTDSLHGAESFS